MGRRILKTNYGKFYIGLKSGGKMLLNIANTPKHKDIESETIRVADEVGFKLEKKIKLCFHLLQERV